ncbi:hotdog fold thioesterase [Halobacteriovorax sp. HLS]|uniref:hotdog fold thioesterase n=1 Tax=Halobacteriovorax sp. HLS TaxID=2234000 RepID=UPI000FDACB60|nr:hotdog fold thioesterase [Halobacteriovorax sp. HLS]
MSIWFGQYDLESINAKGKNSMSGNLGIEVSRIFENGIVGEMPVSEKTKQPFGLLHGGASCVLAETLGSIASNMIIDTDLFAAVGQSINASHIKSASEGEVKGVCTAIHIGKKSHVWEINIYNEEDEIVCASRLTMAIIKKN